MTNSVVIAVQVEELAKDPGSSPGTWDLWEMKHILPGSFNSNSP